MRGALLLALATEQCRAGDDRGLVWRAAARYALACGTEGACERPDGATREALRMTARDLDGYLAAHPRGSLRRGKLEFITSLDAGVARHVAPVRVVARPPGVVVRVGDIPLPDGAALRTVGAVTVAVSSERHETATLAVTAEAGTATSLAIVESPEEPAPGARSASCCVVAW